MIPFDMLDSAVTGTRFEWIVVVILLPFVGGAVARSWGPSGVLAAQRALLLVAIDIGLGLVLGWPIWTAPLLIAILPLVGASISRTRADLRSKPLAWIGAVLMAIPVVSLAHLGPYLWAAWWFIGLFGAALVRGIVEPLVDRMQTAWPAVRAWWRERQEAADASTE